MKLQNLIVIFILIIIPIVIIFSLYLNLETKTILLQTDYDEKLIEATKEAVEAFEINTVEWNSEYSALANSKRQDIMSSINIFTTSLADKLRIGGTSKESILTYVPAIVFTMYDGYYIYTPTHVPQTITNNNGVQLFYYASAPNNDTKVIASATQNIGGTIISGDPMYSWGGDGTATGTYNGITFTTNIENADKTYKHVLKTFVPYTTNKTLNGKEYVINYTLDNYVRIYGAEDSVVDEKIEGYIIEGFGSTNKIELTVNNISGIKYNDQIIEQEILTEYIPVRDNVQQDVEIKSYPYIYNSSNDKRYYDETVGKFFTVNKNYLKVYLSDTTIGSSLAEYKKVLVCTNAASGEYIELYQLLNGSNQNWFYIDEATNEYTVTSLAISIDRKKDCSAINYYVENYYFNKWIRSSSGLNLSETSIQDILNEKNEEIITNINNNLNLSLSNYSSNSEIDYVLPELSATDWEQALSNISVITFFQGTKIGLKTYNNYVVVTSTQNNEYVSEESLYYINNSDLYYHRYACKHIKDSNIDGIYKNTEFKVKSYDYVVKTVGAADSEYSKYYYRHLTTNGVKQECFECIVNKNNLENDISIYEKELYTALARERYIQIQRTHLTKDIEIIITNPEESIPVEATEPIVAIYDVGVDSDKTTYMILANEIQKITSKRIVCEDDSGIASVQYVVNQSSTTPTTGWNTITNNSTISATFKVGTNYIHVKAKDGNGNVKVLNKTYVVNKDASMPTVNIYDVGVNTDTTTYTISSSETQKVVNKRIVCSDENGIASVQYVVNQSSATPTTGWNTITNNTTISVTFKVGTNYIHVKTIDVNGNEKILDKPYVVQQQQPEPEPEPEPEPQQPEPEPEPEPQQPLKVTFTKNVTEEWFGMRKNVKITFTITGGSGSYSVSENGTNKTISGNTHSYETTVTSIFGYTLWPSVTFEFKDTEGQTVTIKFQDGNVTT